MKRLIRYIRAKMLRVPFRERVWYNYSAMLKKAERKSPNVTHVVIFDDNGNYIDCPPIGGEVTYSIMGKLYKYKVVGFKNESRNRDWLFYGDWINPIIEFVKKI